MALHTLVSRVTHPSLLGYFYSNRRYHKDASGVFTPGPIWGRLSSFYFRGDPWRNESSAITITAHKIVRRFIICGILHLCKHYVIINRHGVNTARHNTGNSMLIPFQLDIKLLHY